MPWWLSKLVLYPRSVRKVQVHIIAGIAVDKGSFSMLTTPTGYEYSVVVDKIYLLDVPGISLSCGSKSTKCNITENTRRRSKPHLFLSKHRPVPAFRTRSIATRH